jgi:hypothetical protein
MTARRSRLARARILAGFALGLALGVASSMATERAARAADPDASQRYFYRGYDYGSQSLYGPVYAIVNRGFDVLQLAPHDRNLYHQDYLLNVRNVFGNVVDPFPAISARGWGTFTRQELLPLTFTQAGARWMPNYGLHLIGGGETYAELREWFLAHDAPPAAATAFSIASLFTAAFINESIENSGVVGHNTDALADLYVFDTMGVLLFSFEPIKKLFSKYILLSDWSLQPALTYPHGDLHNQGNYYAAKLPLPFVPRLRLFGYMGFSSMAGLSVKLDDELSVSLAAGGKISHIDNESKVAVINVVNVRSTAAIFIDRNDSLLASVHVADVPDYKLQVNVYPNAIFHTEPGIGFFGIMGDEGRFMAGLSFTHALGVGIGAGTL